MWKRQKTTGTHSGSRFQVFERLLKSPQEVSSLEVVPGEETEKKPLTTLGGRSKSQKKGLPTLGAPQESQKNSFPTLGARQEFQPETLTTCRKSPSGPKWASRAPGSRFRRPSAPLNAREVENRLSFGFWGPGKSILSSDWAKGVPSARFFRLQGLRGSRSAGEPTTRGVSSLQMRSILPEWKKSGKTS